MKKYWIIIISAIAFFILSAAGIIVFACLNVDGDFYKVSLYEIISLLIDLIIGILVALMIMFLTITGEKQKSKKDILVTYLAKIESKVDDLDRTMGLTNLKLIWNNSLITKSSIETTIRCIKESPYLDKNSKPLIESVENGCRDYFLYIQETFYANAKITEEILLEEHRKREVFKSTIVKAIFIIC